MDQSKKKGSYCAARNCKNKQYKTNESFFKFPNDVARARMWAIQCGREDLLDSENINKIHRLCGAHFENRMFLNVMKNRLQPNALPTIFPSLEGSSSVDNDHNYSVFIPDLVDPLAFTVEEMASNDNGYEELSSFQQPPSAEETCHENQELHPPEIRILQNISLNSGEAENQDVNLPSLFCYENIPLTPDINTPQSESDLLEKIPLTPIHVNIPQYESDLLEKIPLTSRDINIPQSESDLLEAPWEPLLTDSSTQTSQSLSAHSPRKEQMRQTIKSLRRENSKLRKKLEECDEYLHFVREDIMNCMTLDQYILLTRKFCPSQELANFIIDQVSEIRKEPKG